MKRRIGGLGWVRDLPDPRDHVYSAPLAALQALPPAVDLQPGFPIYDQGRIGSLRLTRWLGQFNTTASRAGRALILCRRGSSSITTNV
jgi:hypothetical protein